MNLTATAELSGIALVKRMIAILTSITALFCSIFGIPYYPSGDRIDMSQFELSFEDEFDGDTVDWKVWSGHLTAPGGASFMRRGGYWNADLVETVDGNLIIPLKYLSDGYAGGGPGWYSAAIETQPDGAGTGFTQTYGYFEVRCILPKCADCWAAFWMMNDGVYRVGEDGMDGTEIDVFESPYYGKAQNNMVSSDLHYDGYNEEHQHLGAKKYLIKGDPYSEFNTYGVEWNENEYVFYINGVESFRTSYGGVSRNPEHMLLSVEVSGENGVFPYDSLDKNEEYDFIVDYVRVYQYKELPAK